MNTKIISNTLKAWLDGERSFTEEEIVTIISRALKAWAYAGMDLTKDEIVAMREQWESVKLDTPELLRDRIDRIFARIQVPKSFAEIQVPKSFAEIQVPKSFASQDNLECFVHDVNEALERFAPELLSGTYKKVKSCYVYEKDDLKISAQHIYKGIHVLVTWKEGEYVGFDIQGAVSKWAQDYHYHG